MSDELRAAAARWRKGGYVPGIYPECGANDAIRMVLAYLAEHPADDEEPVTEKWLRGVGFVGKGNPMRIAFPFGDVRVIAINHFYDGIEIWNPDDGVLALKRKAGLARADALDVPLKAMVPT